MTQTNKDIDWQGHRGCRGLLPENTIPAFIKALEFPIKTLELDVAISKDNKVIVTHEPWFSSSISTLSNGDFLTKEQEEDYLIYQMTYEEIKKIDVGLRGNPKFEQQKAIPVHKPSLEDMVKAVEQHCTQTNIPFPFYDIEIKSDEKWYGTKTPQPEEYVKIVLSEIDKLGITNRMNLQSFDVHILNEVHRQNPKIKQAYLIQNLRSLEDNLELIDFKPAIYSPYYKLVTKKMLQKVHAKNIKLIPWTVNNIVDMDKLINLGVDGIITDYPNKIEETSYYKSDQK